MKTLIIYTSMTGFTEKYAKWLAKKVDGLVVDLDLARKKEASFFNDFDVIVFGGWANAGKIHKSKWFLDSLEKWPNKKLAIFCVGASPIEGNDELEEAKEKMLTAREKELVKLFYLPGGLNYEKMPFIYRMVMKAFAKAMKKKKPEANEMHEMIGSSYDISDEKYLDDLVDYIKE